MCSKVYLAHTRTGPENRNVKSWLGFPSGLAVMAAALTTKSPTVDDFPACYRAAQHPGAVCATTNSGLGGHFLPWLRIPSCAWILQPLGSLPYETARVLWLITIAVALALFAGFASFENWPGRAALFALSPLPFLAILPGTTRVTALLGGALLIFSTCVVLRHSVAIRRAEAPARQACPAAS